MHVEWRRSFFLLPLLLTFGSARADDAIPPCALSGSMTISIGGRPALRLSDVANCPAELYEVITSVSIDGQPMVHFKTGATKDTDCAARGDATVSAEGKQVTRLGDVDCRAK